MDFNYALRPHPLFLIHQLNDNAFGKVRTLAYLPKQDGQALTENQLFEALRNGRTLLTDGPVCLFYLQLEGEDRIYRFGETVTLSSGKNLKLSLKWQSTPEFGAIEKINLFLGTKRGEKDIRSEIDFSMFGDSNYGLQGESSHVFSNWTESPCYLRLEAASMIDPENEGSPLPVRHESNLDCCRMNGGQKYEDTKHPILCSDRASTRLYPCNPACDFGDHGLRKYLAGSFHCLHYLNPAASRWCRVLH